MTSQVRKTWEEFLDPAITRSRLIAASVYIAAFESLQNAIIGRIRDFYSNGFDENGDKIDPKYQAAVLSRNRSPIYASLDWLRESGAIEAVDIVIFDKIKTCRNHLAHRLFKFLGSEGLPSELEQCFADMVALLRKIEVWWIANVEIATDPDFVGRDVDENEILPGRVIMLQVLLDIALGSEAESRQYIDEYRRRTGECGQAPRA